MREVGWSDELGKKSSSFPPLHPFLEIWREAGGLCSALKWEMVAIKSIQANPKAKWDSCLADPKLWHLAGLPLDPRPHRPGGRALLLCFNILCCEIAANVAKLIRCRQGMNTFVKMVEVISFFFEIELEKKRKWIISHVLLGRNLISLSRSQWNWMMSQRAEEEEGKKKKLPHFSLSSTRNKRSWPRNSGLA